MKLICCAVCTEIFNLWYDYKECKGGHGGGQYVDILNAKVWGDPSKIFVLGFSNSSFTQSLRDQLHMGDSDETFMYGGRLESRGRDFTAFVIPESATSVTRVLERFDPIVPNIMSRTQGPIKD